MNTLASKTEIIYTFGKCIIIWNLSIHYHIAAGYLTQILKVWMSYTIRLYAHMEFIEFITLFADVSLLLFSSKCGILGDGDTVHMDR